MPCFDSLSNSVGLSRPVGMPFYSVLAMVRELAKSVIEKQRGKHPLYAFPLGKPDGEGNETTFHHMNDSAWKKARVTWKVTMAETTAVKGYESARSGSVWKASCSSRAWFPR